MKVTPSDVSSSIEFSHYGRIGLEPSPVSRMMATFSDSYRAGVDINLGVGYVNEETMPTEAIIEATRYVLSNPTEFAHALNYGKPAGSPRLISALIDFLARTGVGGRSRSELERQAWVIGTGGITSLLEAIATVLAPGVVLTADPVYYIYANLLARLGFTVVSIPEDEHGIDLEKLEEVAMEHLAELSFIYVLGVGNPTSTILSEERRKALPGLVRNLISRKGREVPCFVDNAYELLIHDPQLLPPASCLAKELDLPIYELGTLSKVFAPALRIGYLTGPPGPLVDAITQRVNDVSFSAPQLNQDVASYLLTHAVDAHRETVNKRYREKARLTREALIDEAGDELEDITGGSAGFYYYVTLKSVETTEASPLYRFLTRRSGEPSIDSSTGQLLPRLYYLPGEHCVNPEGKLIHLARRQLRISYGYESDAQLKKAMTLLGHGLRYAQG